MKQRQNKMKLEKITTKGAQHTIITHAAAFYPTMEAMMHEYRSSSFFSMQCWSPDNGACFKTTGAASRWLKTLLGKTGWSESTRWIIQPRKVCGSELSIEVYLASPKI